MDHSRNALGKRTLGILLFASVFCLVIHNAFARSTNTKETNPPRYALCIVPVADVLGGPISSENLDWYQQKICADNLSGTCRRIDQLLFNEVAEIQQIYRNGEQVCIKLPGKIFETHSSTTPQTNGWVLGSNVRILNNEDIVDKLPAPLSLKKSAFPNSLHNTVTLKKPVTIPGARTDFSSGTRFVIKNHGKNTYEVWWFNPTTNAIDTLNIPTQYCIAYDENLSPNARRQLMVDIARSFIHRAGEVPYVWGGCSMIHGCHDQVNQKLAMSPKSGEPIIFDRNQPEVPRTGFDCSGLILRTANMAGIPLFYKNSITMARHLREITDINDLKIGDVIWIPGHVMMVSSLDKNLLIEARHYMHGYGRVHEIPLDEEFAGIKTYKDLLASMKQKKPIIRKARNGTETGKLREIKLLSLMD